MLKGLARFCEATAALAAVLLLLSSCPSAPTCDDREKNGAETDVDCGGSGVCPRCAAGKSCREDSDCLSGICGCDDKVSGVCSTSGTCEVARCPDQVKNGTETDVDCGGPGCPGCEAGLMCKTGSDCLSTVCDEGRCTASSCSDRMKNGYETDVDCGGANECERCAIGQKCERNDDCGTEYCDLQQKVCAEPTCTDGVSNGTETDVDCGGPSCPKCEVGQRCQGGEDCISDTCGAGRCQISPCADGIKNGTETDVDCGGEICPKCALGKACRTGEDCELNSCVNSECRKPDCANGQMDGGETGVDCGGPCSVVPFPVDQCLNQCKKCPRDEGCKIGADCLSNLCVNGVCS